MFEDLVLHADKDDFMPVIKSSLQIKSTAKKNIKYIESSMQNYARLSSLNQRSPSSLIGYTSIGHSTINL